MIYDLDLYLRLCTVTMIDDDPFDCLETSVYLHVSRHTHTLAMCARASGAK